MRKNHIDDIATRRVIHLVSSMSSCDARRIMGDRRACSSVMNSHALLRGQTVMRKNHIDEIHHEENEHVATSERPRDDHQQRQYLQGDVYHYLQKSPFLKHLNEKSEKYQSSLCEYT